LQRAISNQFLGIKELKKFSRALKMRWLWYMWDQKERPWKGIFIITDLTDRQLLFCSTTVTIGDGKCTLFWEARWLNGTSPKEITPSLVADPCFLLFEEEYNWLNC
jgi:hypothetical protein